MSDHVTIYEVGPRDGLQNHPAQVSTPNKIRLIDLLQSAGLDHIEVASFVNPKVVPQMADGAQVLAGLHKRKGDIFGALAPNMRGAEEAVASGATEIAVFISASETFSQKNTNCTIEEGLERARHVARYALDSTLTVRGYISCVAGCPYEGDIASSFVAELSTKLLEMGCREISLGDTIGCGTPNQVRALIGEIVPTVPAHLLAGHFHDTGGLALQNVEAAMGCGIRVFDASIAGLGGCPFAPGASGNVATERVVQLLHKKGLETGINTDALSYAAEFALRLTMELEAQ